MTKTAWTALPLVLLLAACGGSQESTPPADETGAPAPEPATQPAPVDDAEIEAEEEEPIPGTDIWIGRLSWDESGAPVLTGEVDNLTNRSGYDNQPWFTPDGGSILFSSGDESGQTDIMRLDIETGALNRLTDTPRESEYSPRIAPDGSTLSYIHQAEGGYGGQVWRADMDGGNAGPVFDYGPNGYYAWSADMSQLAVFSLTDPFTLRVAEAGSADEPPAVADNPGRTLLSHTADGVILFTLPNENEGFTVYELDLASGEYTPSFDLPNGSQDMWAGEVPAGFVYFSADSERVYYRAPGDDAWTDAGAHGLTGVTRIAVSPDGSRIAIVAAE